MKSIVFLCIATIIIILSVYANTSGLLTDQYDDAYITYRYAVNLANGDGLTFNIGERTDAASSFLYTVVLAGFYKVGFHDLESVSMIISICSWCLLSLTLFASLTSLSVSKVLSTVIAVFVMTSGLILGWILSGMETIFFTCLVTLFVYNYFVLGKSSCVSSLLLVLIILTRHEGLMLVPFYAWSETKQTRLKYLYIVIVIFLYYLWRYEYYGLVVPWPMQIKSIMVYYQPNPMDFFNRWATYYSLPMVLTVSSVLLIPRRLYPLLVFTIFSWFVFCFGTRADHLRYSVYVLPLMGILSGVVLQKLIETKKLFVLVVMILSLWFWGSYSHFRIVNRSRLQAVQHQIARKFVGKFVKDNIPTDQLIVSSDIGMIAYIASNHEFIDMIGLTSANVGRRYLDKSNIDSILKERRPKYIADTINLSTYNGFKPQRIFNNGIKSDILSEIDIKLIGGNKVET